MTEAKKVVLTGAYRAHKTLQLDIADLEDNTAFAAYLADQLRRLPAPESRINAMMEILAILNRFVRVQGDVQ